MKHVADVGVPEGAAHRCFQELRVFAEDPEFAREAEVRRQRQAPLLELFRHQPPMLADVHPSLEDEKGHDDRNDGPEDARAEARKAREPGERQRGSVIR